MMWGLPLAEEILQLTGRALRRSFFAAPFQGKSQAFTIEALEYTLLAFSSLFVIVDPISTVPVFLAMTSDNSPASAFA